MAEKEFKTISEQLEILRQRGLKINGDEKAKDFLLKNNYYRISGYSLTLRSNDVFFPQASFQNIVDIYCFDHEIRSLLLKYLETIEVTFKSVYAYEFSRINGPLEYLSPHCFTDADKHRETIEKAKKQEATRRTQEAFLKHFSELNQELPLWVFVDLLTIANISVLYSISQADVQSAVAKHLCPGPQGEYLLGRFMHSLTILRNLCAHGGRLFNRLFEQKPKLSTRERKMLRINEDGGEDNEHLFSYVLVMRRLLAAPDFEEMKTTIENLEKKYPFVALRYYGFPDDWKEILE